MTQRQIIGVGGVNINDHPLIREVHELCLKIEGFPASEAETRTVTVAGELLQHVHCLVKGLPIKYADEVVTPSDRLDRDRMALERARGTLQDLCIIGADAERHGKAILDAAAFFYAQAANPENQK